MQFLVDLWMPIVASAVAVFIVSSILWMATLLHKGDYSTPPDENGLLSILKGFKPGQYYVPWCHGANMKDPAFAAKMKAGPWAVVTVASQAPSFGRSLTGWFVSQLVVSVFVAYLAAAAIPTGAGAPEYLKVFRIVGAAALLAQAGMVAQNSVWHGVPWRITFVKLFDGIVYALITAGLFGWLWPRGA